MKEQELNFDGIERVPLAVFTEKAYLDYSMYVILDRAQNRHVAFGAGIHRCARSDLARMEGRDADDEWIKRIPSFGLADNAEVTWAGGQVRGPRQVPVAF